MDSSEKLQRARIKEKAQKLLLSGRFGDGVSGLNEDNFRVEITAYAFGVYGDGEGANLERALPAAREFMKKALTLIKQSTADPCLYIARMDDAEAILDKLAGPSLL